MSTANQATPQQPQSQSSGINLVRSILFGLAMILTIFYIAYKSNSDSEQIASDGTSELSVPPFSHKYFTLTKGDTIPLKNYDGWVLYCSSAGTPKKPNLFMHKDEGANWEICGDWQGNELVDHGIGETGFDAYLTAYNKDVQVICWYEKMKNNVKK